MVKCENCINFERVKIDPQASFGCRMDLDFNCVSYEPKPDITADILKRIKNLIITLNEIRDTPLTKVYVIKVLQKVLDDYEKRH